VPKRHRPSIGSMDLHRRRHPQQLLSAVRNSGHVYGRVFGGSYCPLYRNPADGRRSRGLVRDRPTLRCRLHRWITSTRLGQSRCRKPEQKLVGPVRRGNRCCGFSKRSIKDTARAMADRSILRPRVRDLSLLSRAQIVRNCFVSRISGVFVVSPSTVPKYSPMTYRSIQLSGSAHERESRAHARILRDSLTSPETWRLKCGAEWI
jgi:hypothetical protein